MSKDSEKILKYLKDRGYEVKFFTEEKAFKPPVYYAAIMNGDEIIRKNESKISPDDALKTAYQILKLKSEKT